MVGYATLHPPCNCNGVLAAFRLLPLSAGGFIPRRGVRLSESPSGAESSETHPQKHILGQRIHLLILAKAMGKHPDPSNNC